jgi:hypothetical protein
MVEVDDGGELRQQHVVIPIDEIGAVIIAGLEEVPESLVPELDDIEVNFLCNREECTGPRLHDFTQFVSLYKLEELEVDEVLYWSLN